MIEDMIIELRDDNGNLTGMTRAVTPAEISDAHPKCGSCWHRGDTWYDDVTLRECVCGDSPYHVVDPEFDYCRWHSHLMMMKGKEDDKR